MLGLDGPRYCPAAALLAAKASWLIWEAPLSDCCVEKDCAEYCEYGESEYPGKKVAVRTRTRHKVHEAYRAAGA